MTRALWLCLLLACAPALKNGPKSGPAVFAGQALALAPGCTAYPSGGSTTVQCGGDENLVWVKDAGDVSEEVFLEAFTEELGRFGAISQRFRMCEVQGVPAQCQLFDVVSPKPSRVSALFVGLQIRGEKLRLVCIHQHRPADPALPVCSQLVLIK